jgi:hypothetical protein
VDPWGEHRLSPLGIGGAERDDFALEDEEAEQGPHPDGEDEDEPEGHVV